MPVDRAFGKIVGTNHLRLANQPLKGAPPVRAPTLFDGMDGRIAQLVEQLTLNQRVLGSSPSASTTPPHD